MRYMTRVGYDPAAQGDVMKMLAKLDKGNEAPQFLSTHPSSESRLKQVNKLLATKYKNVGGERDAGRYEQMVLARLEALPPPRHTQAMANAAALQQRALERQQGIVCQDTPEGRRCERLGRPVSEPGP
jgi:predicted Zn-dependent protease